MSDRYLGIFGDSSADPNRRFNHSWVELLRNEIEFDNFAVRGSGLCFTYNELLEHGHRYKNLLVFVAPIGRLWVPDFEIQQHFINVSTVELIYDKASRQEQKKLDSVKSYFYNIWNYEREKIIQRAMVDSIRKMFPNALLIPVCNDSIYDNCGISMRDISLLDYEFHQVHEYTPDFGRTCHMNEENNRIFYHKIKQWLDTKNFVAVIKDFKYPKESKQELFEQK